MQRIEVNGNLYIVKKTFPFNRIKNEQALFEIKSIYGADYLIKENNSQVYFLVQKIEEATILEEIEKYMILSGKNVTQHLATSEYSKINQVGVDLSVKKIEQINLGGRILKDKTIISDANYNEMQTSVSEDGLETWSLLPGVYALTFNEKVTIPPNYTGFIVSRSSIYRMGSHINSPIWDPGFTTGDNEMGTTMVVHVPIEIEKNARVAQFYMIQNEYVNELYNGQFQNKTNY